MKITQILTSKRGKGKLPEFMVIKNGWLPFMGGGKFAPETSINRTTDPDIMGVDILSSVLNSRDMCKAKSSSYVGGCGRGGVIINHDCIMVKSGRVVI